MGSDTFIICSRNVKSGEYGGEPGVTKFLVVPGDREEYDPGCEVRKNLWRSQVLDAADGALDELTGSRGDVLVFVHGYNNSIQNVLARTRMLQSTLDAQGWKGLVVGFDWPSENSTLNYLEDRTDAAEVSFRLVREALDLVIAAQNNRSPGGRCELNIHLLGHSTGAYVIMEAFKQAESRGAYYKSNWRIGQVAFIGGDVSSSSLEDEHGAAGPMYKRILRLTNYSNKCDRVLAVSNAKRFGTAPRAGRIGVPEEAPRKAVNVDCTEYFMAKDPKKSFFEGTFCHSWHIGDPAFALDLALTLEGGMDRDILPTRRMEPDGLVLTGQGGRPRFQALWDLERGEK